ncbi:MAG: hypothetical protein AAGA86_05560 [Bacteroidota bacterium]
MRFLIFPFFALFLLGPRLEEIRKNFPMAQEDPEIARQLYKALASVSQEDSAILVAYKGALSTIRAKHGKALKDKKAYFKEGTQLLETAVARDPNNIEIRCLRLGVQENAPKFLKYKGSIAADKQLILDGFPQETSQEVKDFVKGFVLASDSFSHAEKQLF